MGTQKLSRRWIGRVWLAGALALGLLTPACAPDYVAGNNAPVNMYIVKVESGGGSAAGGGTVMHSDVRTEGDGTKPPTICPDNAVVSVAVRNKNPQAPIPNVASAVIVESYAVRFFRTDGRGVEGVDVPYRITGKLTVAIDVANAGATDIPIEIVRYQAKVEPPLSTIFQTSVLTTMAEITLGGRTIAGETVSGTGQIQVDFANFGDQGSCTQG
jgi:hypothetical protein